MSGNLSMLMDRFPLPRMRNTHCALRIPPTLRHRYRYPVRKSPYRRGIPLRVKKHAKCVVYAVMVRVVHRDLQLLY